MSGSLGLSYVFAHPTALTLHASAPEWFWLLIVPAALLALEIHRGTPRRAALRITSLCAVIAALARLDVQLVLPDDRLSIVAVVDRSQSIDAEGHRWQERYVAELSRSLAPTDRLSIVPFATQASWFPAASDPTWARASHDGGATDIEAALALALGSSTGSRRLVLLSDGHQTRGSALTQLTQARADGVPIFVAVPPPTGGQDIAIEKLIAPTVTTVDAIVPLQLTLSNHGRERPVELSLRLDGTPLGSQTVRAQPGLTAVELPLRLKAVGAHQLEARLEGLDDRIAANDSIARTISVVGNLRALAVGGGGHPLLQRALGRRGIEVSLHARDNGPLDAATLDRFAAVVVEDAASADLAPRDWSAIEEFVRQRGGALLFAGGAATYGDRGFGETAMKAALPLTFEPDRPSRPRRPPLGLFLVIDHSNSMGYHFRRSAERSTSESKLVYAQRAALEVLDQLKPNDQIGVIAFNALPQEVTALRVVSDVRTQLAHDIERLVPDGGTDFYDALQSAGTQLAAARVGSRHVILLTDGDTNRGGDHGELIAQLESNNVSVTTIRIGDDQANLGLLTTIARRTGGQFFHVENADALPELMLRDTGRALARLANDAETYAPKVREPSEALRGIKEDEIPDLSGYAFAQAKPGADVLLDLATQNDHHPLLAVWQYGLGRVVAFTASPSEDGGAWLAWDQLSKFWGQLARWAARDRARADYGVVIHREAGQARLEVLGFRDEVSSLWARVQVDADHRIELPLERVGARRWQAPMPKVQPGNYRVTIVDGGEAHAPAEQTQEVRYLEADEPAREEVFRDQPNLALLTQLADGSGGAVNAPMARIVEHAPGRRVAQRGLDWLWAMVAATALLLEARRV